MFGVNTLGWRILGKLTLSWLSNFSSNFEIVVLSPRVCHSPMTLLVTFVDIILCSFTEHL